MNKGKPLRQLSPCVQSPLGAQCDTAAALLVQERPDPGKLSTLQPALVAELQGGSSSPDPLPCPGEASKAQGYRANVSCFEIEEIFLMASGCFGLLKVGHGELHQGFWSLWFLDHHRK